MFAVLHVTAFALQAVLRTERPPAGDQPAALFGDRGKKSTVLAANPAACAAGVEPGQTAPQAVARCASLLIRTASPAAEAEARAILLAAGLTLSPTVEATAPGVCTIDLRGADPAQVPVAARAAVAELARLHLAATAGLAATPLLALYAARQLALAACSPSAPDQPSSSSSERKASERPENAVVLHVSDAPRFLAPLPLALAEPPADLAPVLAAWGLRTLGDLTALPRDDLVRRFGAAGLALWTRATGGAPRPLHPVQPPRSFGAELKLEDDIETLEPLLFILRRWLDRLALELRATQQVASELALTLTLADATVQARQFRLPEPTAEADILFRALHTHLESLQTAAAISAVQLALTPVRPLVRQQGLFETGLRDPHGFAETLARVAALVGADRIGTPRSEETHRPDALTLTPPAAVVAPPAAPPVQPPLGLPLRRFRPPVPVKLELTDRRPTYLWGEAVQGAITTVRGPWRSSGDWWQRDRAWARTEWDIALAGGGLYRLLLVGDAWFLEGEYD